MKRHFYFFLALALIFGTLFLSSCSKSSSSTSSAGNPAELKVTGYYGNQIPKLKTPGKPVMLMFTGSY